MGATSSGAGALPAPETAPSSTAAVPSSEAITPGANMGWLLGFAAILGAGSGGGSKGSTPPAPGATGYLIDSPVGGVDYYINGVLKGKTAADGSFAYSAGDVVTFKVANITLGQLSPNSDGKVYVQDLAGVERSNLTDAKMVKIAQLLQTLDADGNPGNGIAVDVSKIATEAEQVISANTDLAALLDAGVEIVSESAAVEHLKPNNPDTSELETIAPTATLELASTLLKAGGSTLVTLRFSEAVKLWDDINEMLTVTSGTLGTFSTTDGGLSYTGLYTAGAASAAQIRLSGNFSDLSGNAGEAAQTNVAVDLVLPTLTITDDKTSGAATGPVTYTFTFSEVVKDFTAKDITVANGSMGALVASTVEGEAGKVFTMVVTPPAGAEGADLGVSVGTAWSDTAGNAPANITVAQAQAYDTKTPTLTITDDKISGAATGPVTYTFTFSEVVKDFTADDITVANGSKGTLVASTVEGEVGKVFTMVVTPPTGTPVPVRSGISLAPAAPTLTTAGAEGADLGVSVGTAWSDTAGNAPANITVAEVQAYDTKAPTLTITDDKTSGAATGPVTYTFTFSEAVTDFTADDITVNNGSKGTLVASTVEGEAGKVFTMVVTPPAGEQGDDLGVSVGTAWSDTAGNAPANTTSAEAQAYDTKAPTAKLLTPPKPVQLDGLNKTNGADFAPQITAVGNSGEYVVTWYGRDSENDYSIFVQKFNADGIQSGTVVQLEALNRTDGTDTVPQIAALGQTGEFVVTWQGNPQSPKDYDSIYVQKFASDGSKASTNAVQLLVPNTPFLENYDPQITALGNEGAFAVTWWGVNSNEEFSVFVQRFNADGSAATPVPVQLDALNADYQGNTSPQITSVGNAGEFVVTWGGVDSENDNSIFVQRFNADGTTAGGTRQIEALNKTNGSDGNPQITAVGSTGEYVLTWQGLDTEGDNSIFVQKFNADGSQNGATVQLEATNKSNGPDQAPQITAVGNAGEFVVTWSGTDSENDYSVFVQKFNADGSQNGATVQLEATNKSNGLDLAPQITAVGNAGEFVVTWYGQDSENDYSIFVQKFNADGSKASQAPTQLEALNVANLSDSYPQITALGTEGEFVVTWTGVVSSGESSIFVQRFGADGLPAGGSATASAPMVVNASSADVVPVQSSEVGKAYVVHSSINMAAGLGALTEQNNTLWKSVDIAAANSSTDLSTSGLENGRYSLYTVDAAGNLSPAVSNALWIDKAQPTLTITDNKASGVATGPVTYTFTFSEVVKDFTADDITVAKGSKGTLVASTVEGEVGKVFTMVVTPPEGEEGADLGVSVGKVWSDTAGNAPANSSTAEAQAYDNKAPSLTITDDKISGAATGPVTYTFTFSEVVKDFTADDITVTKGSKGTLVPSTVEGEVGKVFTMVVTPPAGEEGTDLGVRVGTAWSDTTGNAPATTTTASAQAYDTLAPTAKLDLPSSTVQLEAIGKTDGEDLAPQITAVGSTGEFVVTWSGQDSDGDSSIFVQKFNADGTSAGTMVQLDAIGKTNGDDEYPQITAVGSTGEFVVTWHGVDSDNDYSIFVQKFKADGTSAGTTVELEAIGKTNGEDVAPQITSVGSTGAFVVTWQGQDSDGDFSIFVQKFNADGTSAGTMVQLEAIGKTNGEDVAPQITSVGSTGEFVLTWQGQDSQGDQSIFVQKFNADGSQASSPMVQLEAVGKTNGDDSAPQITSVGSTGAFVVTWQGPDSDSYNDNSIFVQKFNADGTSAGTMVKLEAIGKINGPDWYSQITAVGSTGEFVVTWTGQDSENDNSIFVQKFNADGTSAGTIVQLEAIGKTNGDDWAPQITAVGSTGEFVVTWYGADSQGDNSVFVQKFGADGLPVAGPHPVINASTVSGLTVPVQSTEAGMAYLVHSSINMAAGVSALIPLNEALWNSQTIATANTTVDIATTGLDDGEYRLYTADASGNLSQAVNKALVIDTALPTLTITDNKASGAASGPVTYTFTFSEAVKNFTADDIIVANGSKGTLVASTVEGEVGKVFTMVVTPPAGAEGADIGLRVGLPHEDTWSDLAGNTPERYAAFANAQAYDTLAPTVKLLTAPKLTQLEAPGVSNAYDGSAQISAVGNAGEFVVTWVGQIDADNGGGFIQRFDASGTATGPTVELGRSPYGASNPQVTALGAAGAYAVTWAGYDSSNWPYVFVQKFNANGATDGLAVKLSGTENYGSNSDPQITALGDAGAFVVTWYGRDSGSDDSVFVQKFNTDGSPSGGVVVLEDLNNTSGYDQRPQITALGQSGEFVVTWQGQESAADGGDNSIYVQKFNADGSKATELPLKLEASDNATGWDEAPQIAALGSSGEFVVTWQGPDSDGDKSIYVQKFGADGMPSGNTVKLEPLGVQDSYDQEPQIAPVGTSGEFVVTWQGADTESNYRLFLQKFDLDGAPQGNTVQLQADLSGNSTYVDNSKPQITALGSTGEFVVTWEARDGNGDNSIFVQKFASDASTLGSQVQLEALNKADGDDTSVQITALGTAGEFAVTWEGTDSNGDNSVFVQKFNADGSVAITAVTGAAGDVTVPITSSEAGMAYLVHNSIDLSALGLDALTANNDALWNSMAVAQANTQLDISTAGLDAGSYNLYTADAAGNWAVTLGVLNASLRDVIL